MNFTYQQKADLFTNAEIEGFEKLTDDLGHNSIISLLLSK